MLATHAQPPATTVPTESRPGVLWARSAAVVLAAIEWLSQTVCGISGHRLAFRFEPNRMSLHCLDCGHTTPGWTIRHVSIPSGGVTSAIRDVTPFTFMSRAMR